MTSENNMELVSSTVFVVDCPFVIIIITFLATVFFISHYLGTIYKLSDNIVVKEEEIKNYSNLYDPKKRRKSIDEVHIEGITGKHVNVAVIDSYDIRFQNGIQENHDVYNNRSWNIEDVILDSEKENLKKNSIEVDHALKMATIIGGKKVMGSRLSIENKIQDTEYIFHGGIAPDANVTIYLCSGWPSSIVRALRKVYNKEDPPFDIISMSLGYHVDIFSDIIQDIKNKYPNIIIVAAGGNGGNWWGVQYPAKLPDVVGVGALDTNFNKWDCTAKGPEIDIYDCGVAVSPKADPNESFHSKKMFEPACGTSTAAARITGTLCLFLEVIKRRARERNEPIVNINKEFMLELLGNVIWFDGYGHFRDLHEIITWKDQFLCKLDHYYYYRRMSEGKLALSVVYKLAMVQVRCTTPRSVGMGFTLSSGLWPSVE